MSMYESLRGSDERLRGTNKALMTRTAMHPLKILAVVGAAFLMWGLLFADASSPAQAATLTVNSLDDTTANDGRCTLREAILNANANDQSGSTDCAVGSGSDAIRVGVTGTVQLSGVLPDLSSDLQIEGPGADQFRVRRDTGGDYRIFIVSSDGSEAVVSISGITISNGNVPNSLGGSILNFGTLTVTGSTISGNYADLGGGFYSTTGNLYNPSKKTTVTNSTISGNSSTRGGGVLNWAGLTVIEHSTITKNTAPSGGGSGVASSADVNTRTEVLSSIISDNANTDVDFLGVVGISPNTFASNGYNLIGDGNATSEFIEAGDQTNVGDPKLGALADNGGPTNTHALLAGSPAIDKGNIDLTTDQRGERRPFDDPTIAPATGGDNSDIGSFEAQSVLNSAPEAEDDAYSTDEDAALRVATPYGVLANDAGDTLTAKLVDDVDNGTLTLNSDGSFDYTPNAEYNGPDSFTYKATDDSNTVTVSITVSPVNDAPAATDDARTMNGDGAPITIDLASLVSDVETSDANLTYNIVSGPTPAQGTLSGTGSTRTFDSADNFNGSVETIYTVTDRGDPDGCGTPDDDCDAPETSAQGKVTVNVSPVSGAPTLAVSGGSCLSDTNASGRLNFTVGDEDSPLDSLVLSATSSDTTLRQPRARRQWDRLRQPQPQPLRRAQEERLRDPHALRLRHDHSSREGQRRHAGQRDDHRY
jgi:CSLREA domain-containing protein